MTAVDVPAAPTAPQSRDPLESRRTRSWLHLAAIVIAGFVVLVIVHIVVLFRDETMDVLVLTHDVGWGQRLTNDDFGTVELVPAGRLQVVPATDRFTVIGRTTTIGLTAGAILAPTDLNPDGLSAAESHVVGLRVATGHRPAHRITPGSLVCVSPLPARKPCSSSGVASGSFIARVAESGVPDHDGAMTVDVVVGQAQVDAALAAASSQILISLIGA